MADGSHFENCKMRYLSNRLADFDEIYMVFNLINDQKSENLKIQDCRWRPLKKSKNAMSCMFDFDKILHGCVDLASSP